MSTTTQLFLHEEALLLALHDRSGRTPCGSWYQQAIAGAILGELIESGRTRLVEKGKKRKKLFIVPTARAPLGDPVLDEVLRRVHESSKQRTLTDWASRVAHTRRIKHRVASSLCRRGILREVEDRFLFLFRRRSYPEVDHEPERELVTRLRAAVLSDSKDVAERTRVLLSIASSTGLLKRVLTKHERARRKVRLERIVSGEAVGRATKAAVDRARAATMVVVGG